MSTESELLTDLVKRKYRHGFVTDIASDTVAPGLGEDVIRLISAKKNEPAFMLDWRLKAYRRWTRMREPTWAHVHYPPIDFQAISYYSAPKQNKDGPKSLAEVDPKLLETYDKLGIPLHERARLAGVAVDAVFDSVSVATTFKERLAEAGVIFCPFSEAVQNHPELVEKLVSVSVAFSTDGDYPEGRQAFAQMPGMAAEIGKQIGARLMTAPIEIYLTLFLIYFVVNRGISAATRLLEKRERFNALFLRV